MHLELLKMRFYPAAIVLTSLFGSVFSPVQAAEEVSKQRFVITAYYSPLPDQCCYFRGNYESELQFNGMGIKGADGTAVYPGMIAAPPEYSFGTVIKLPGVGVGTVHDRGGRIVQWGDDLHRIDLWMGHGEEGLARALAWGVRTVDGTVYPAGIDEPVPAEGITLSNFPSDLSILASLPKIDAVTMTKNLEVNDQAYGVRVLQTSLKSIGYFAGGVTGNFGDVTKASLAKFQKDFSLAGDGSVMDERTAAALALAVSLKQAGPKVVTLTIGNTGADVKEVQRLLRYFGYYRGRTDGVFDRDLREAVTEFQLAHNVVSRRLEKGAGMVGPATRAAITKVWKTKQVASKVDGALAKAKITDQISGSISPGKTLAKGDSGASVKKVQEALKSLGYLTDKDLTGKFGDRTQAGLLKYQLEKKILKADTDKGAGVFGPATRQMLVADLVKVKMIESKSGSQKK